MTPTENVFLEGKAIPWEDLGNGVQRKILGFDERLMMTHVRFKKGAIGPLHHHEHTQVTYIERGAFEVHIGGEKKTLRSGDCYFVPSNIEHGVVALEEGILVDVFAPMREDFVKKPETTTVKT